MLLLSVLSAASQPGGGALRRAGAAASTIRVEAPRTNEAPALPPIKVVLSILCELCDALEYAHTFADEDDERQGIVHRDVSPSNLIVAQTGHLKVIDFGIAKGSSRPLHTDSGRVKGKLGYMSPEAIECRPIGPPSDIFSAGVVAHELLTAQPLFSARTEHETLRRVREAEVPPPSRKNPRVPALLDRVVLTALERDEGRRLQSAREFRKGLEQVAIEAGIWPSSSEVAAWWATTATIGEHRGAHESSTSRNEAMHRFPQPVSPGSHSLIYPLPGGELSGGQYQAHPANHGSRRFSAGSAEQLRGDLLADSGTQPPLGSADRPPGELPSPVRPASMASPPALPRSRSRAHVVIALAGLCAIGAGFVVYRFAMRPTAAIAPAPSARPPSTPGPALVKFIARPADSIVEIGGKEVSRQSPFEVPLERGVYSVAVSRSGYKRWTTQITLRDLESQTINVALEPASAIVRLSSQPGGLVAQLDGKSLDQVTPAEFETSPGPHRLIVVSATGTWTQDFVAAVDGTHTFHAVFAPAKRAPTAATTSSAGRTTTPASDRTAPRASSSNSASTPAAREPVFETEDRAVELGSDPFPGKPLTKAEPLPRPTGQPDPSVTSPPAPPRPRSQSSAPPLLSRRAP